MSNWDYIVLTASNSEQAKAFSTQLSRRTVRGTVSSDTVFLVVSDGTSGSVGSGGAVLNALKTIFDISGNSDFMLDKRIILINSGGESRRVPQYSVCGKLFSPSAADSGTTLFDDILVSANRLLPRLGCGIVVFSSDIPLVTDLPDGKPYINESTAFVIKAPAKYGEHHGVLVGDNGSFTSLFLHKTDIDTLIASGAVDSDGMINLDTGAIFLDSECVRRIFSLICDGNQIDSEKFSRFVSSRTILNFYGDFIAPLALDFNESIYLNQSFEESDAELLNSCKKDISRTLSTLKIRIDVQHSQPFIHFGTTAETLSVMTHGGSRTAFVNSFLQGSPEIGDGSYIENSIIDSESSVGSSCVISCAELRGISVPSGTAIHCIRLKNGKYTARVFNVSDNIKSVHGLWNKKLYPVCDTRSDAVREALKLCEKASSESCEYTSLASGFKDADFSEPMVWSDYLGNKIRSTVYEDCRKSIINEHLKTVDFDRDIGLVGKSEAVSLTLRVNFGGTWTDAAPFCIQNGGAVLNAAITLNDAAPIEAVAAVTERKSVILKCIDFGISREYTSVSELNDFSDDFDSFSLHKSALIVCGIISPYKNISMNELISRLGGGLLLSTNATGVPAGSGLGTSSILLAALIKALCRLTGKSLSEQELFQMVFCAEQLMKTGGGWQDQVGGCVKGFKLIRSEPGLVQNIQYDSISVSPDTLRELSERFCLIYTGERHCGQYILSEIMSKYTQNRDNIRKSFSETYTLPPIMKKDLESGNIDAFAANLSRQWELLKQMSPNVTTVQTEKIIDICSDYIEGKSICGAGSGGFLQVILKKDISKDDVEKALSSAFPNENVRIFKSSFAM